MRRGDIDLEDQEWVIRYSSASNRITSSCSSSEQCENQECFLCIPSQTVFHGNCTVLTEGRRILWIHKMLLCRNCACRVCVRRCKRDKSMCSPAACNRMPVAVCLEFKRLIVPYGACVHACMDLCASMHASHACVCQVQKVSRSYLNNWSLTSKC